MIGSNLMAVIESALADGVRIHLKQQKDGTVKAQIISAKERRYSVELEMLPAKSLNQTIMSRFVCMDLRTQKTTRFLLETSIRQQPRKEVKPNCWHLPIRCLTQVIKAAFQHDSHSDAKAQRLYRTLYDSVYYIAEFRKVQFIEPLKLSNGLLRCRISLYRTIKWNSN